MNNAPVADRIESLLDYLSVERVHVGACMSADWGGLVGRLKHRVSTLALVAPHLNQGMPAGVATFSEPTVVIAGDNDDPRLG